MSCDVGEVTERLENEQSLLKDALEGMVNGKKTMGGSPGDVSEEPVT